MRLLCITLVIIAGTLMACVGTLCESFTTTGTARFGDALVASGYFMIAVASVLFIIEWWPVPAARRAAQPTAPRTAATTA